MSRGLGDVYKRQEVFGDEGKAVADWIVVDFGQAIVHLLQEESREMYQLEKLWA